MQLVESVPDVNRLWHKGMEEGIGSGKGLVQQRMVIGSLIDVFLANNIGCKVTQMMKYHT